nr:MAG TPA: Paired amphipathic helix protein [Caudoviricetes sp.]
MLTTIHITVRSRVPTITEGEEVISHNSDYVIDFDFDEEWTDNYKTVYFVCEDGSHQPVVINGNTCPVPVLDGEHRRIFVGVQAGSIEKPSVLKTTCPCCLKVRDSIADLLGQPIPDPTPDVYQQIMALLEDIKKGEVSPEDIQKAVDNYLTENPISVDIATTENAGIVSVGKNLSITKDGALSVDTTDDAEQDNTKPITSAGVNLVVGNINAILAII